MALSGTFYKNVGSHWRLQGEWSASQNVSANTSTITLKTYWIALDSYGAVYSSATKSGSSTIEGTVDSFSGSGLAGLSANQKKLLQTQSKTITHNSDGTFPDLDLAVSFDAEVTLGGTYYGTITATATASLNTIPRESSLTSSANWTAGGTVSFSISRASSSFTHDLTIKVNSVTIKTITGVGSSYTWTPSATEQENIFKELAKDTSSFNQASSITLTTKSGSTVIGTNTYTGTVSSPSSSTTTSSLDFNIGDPVSVGITRSDSEFTHTVRFYVGTTLIKTVTGVTTSTTWTPTSTEITNMYNASTTSATPDSKVEIDTFYGATKVKATTSKTGTATVTNSNPTFSITGITAKDTNSTTNTLKGAGYEETIIQGMSTVTVTIPLGSRALPVNGANFTGKQYTATLDGRSLTANYSSTADVTFNFGTISANSNQTLSIAITDSRGLTTTVTKTVTVLKYASPVLVSTAKRKNGFENDTTLTAIATGSDIKINNVSKNTIKSIKYRYRKTTEATSVSTWAVPIGFTVTNSGTTGTATAVILNLDNTLSYYVDIIAEDQLSTKTTSFTVTSGQPILFIDSTKKSVGVGKFPSTRDLEVGGGGNVRATGIYGNYLDDYMLNDHANGNVTVNGLGKYLYLGYRNTTKVLMSQDFYDSTGANVIISKDGKISLPANTNASAGGGINLNNSDIIGANSIYMNDTATADSEAIQWVRDTTPAGSTNPADYDSFRVYGGVAYINSVPISVNPSATTLWSGSSYMNGSQVLTPSKPISQCSQGWILAWSDYDSDTSTANDWDIHYSYIPKKAILNFSGKSMNFPVPSGLNGIVIKYLYVTDTTLTGHDSNDDSTANALGGVPNDIVLRRVWEW